MSNLAYLSTVRATLSSDTGFREIERYFRDFQRNIEGYPINVMDPDVEQSVKMINALQALAKLCSQVGTT